MTMWSSRTVLELSLTPGTITLAKHLVDCLSLREVTFINDSLRNEFHKKFMDKYIK